MCSVKYSFHPVGSYSGESNSSDLILAGDQKMLRNAASCHVVKLLFRMCDVSTKPKLLFLGILIYSASSACLPGRIFTFDGVQEIVISFLSKLPTYQQNMTRTQ